MPLDSTGYSRVVSDLMEARDYLVEYGWCQRASQEGMRVCALGALFAVTGGRVMVDVNRRSTACHALQIALYKKLDQSVSEWNDDPERTLDDVLELYDYAIGGM